MVNALQRVFKRSRVFLPVVHPISKDLCLKAVETALDCHADGIFLVNEGLDAWETLDLIPQVIAPLLKAGDRCLNGFSSRFAFRWRFGTGYCS